MDSNVRAGSSPAFSTDEKKPARCAGFLRLALLENFIFERGLDAKKCKRASVWFFLSK